MPQQLAWNAQPAGSVSRTPGGWTSTDQSRSVACRLPIPANHPFNPSGTKKCALPPRYFVDYLTLLKTNDGWRIVAKAFKTETK